MTEIDLKAYTSRALELESAIYTQKKLMDEHQTLINNQRPVAPKKPNLKMPTRPVKPTEPSSNGGFNLGLGLVLGVPIAIGCIGLISATPVLGLITAALCIYGAINIFSGQNNDKEKARQAMRQYEQDLAKYNCDMERYQRNFQAAQEHYEQARQKYSTMADKYDARSSVIIQQHDDVLHALETALEAHYSSNVIFPKYRNMVAITTINEYLMSGRCYELEGPNGAYNLYEMELRQNIVINQLSNIISNLEQIRNNQYTLYQELTKANETVNDILRELRVVTENTRLTAYFAGVTALIEASPKVYIGHTF